MANPAHPSFEAISTEQLSSFEGAIAVTVGSDGTMSRVVRRLDRMAQGVISRLVEADLFGDLKPGTAHVIAPPPRIKARALIICKLDRKSSPIDSRMAGAAAAGSAAERSLLIVSGQHAAAAEMAFGAVLRRYRFDRHKSAGQKKAVGGLRVMSPSHEKAEAIYEDKGAAATGVYLTRDLVNEPANVLGTEAFVSRLRDMSSLGLKVSVLGETEMKELGMNALLGVGQGSDSPSFLVAMEWNGGGDEKPLAVVGKGVVFDTGGISIKPALNMEEMTVDMGGAAVVAGLMHTLASRHARANVVGIVGLVENMPDGRAQRPGDIVQSMKGDTIEVINTDAEGRLVLADALWHTQEQYAPSAIVDLATLTGAIIVGLGHEMAGVFSNDDKFCEDFLKSARSEREGAWRMPVGGSYRKLLKSRKADINNVGGRSAGSVTAAEFLLNFIREGIPWIHLDIAGVVSLKARSDFAPRGATGWGVLALDRLVRDRFESGDDA